MGAGTHGELLADYDAAGFGGRLPFGRRPALVLVDVVDAYVDAGSPLYAGVENALAGCVRLVEVARKFDAPVVYTRVAYTANGADGGWFYRKVRALKCFDEGSQLGAFCAGIEPRSNELVVTKQYPSAFFGTSLASSLRHEGVDTVIIGGFSTSGCVRATALDALQHGFAPYVVKDACGDRHPGPHGASLFDLQAKYAEVVSEAELVGLLGGARGRA